MGSAHPATSASPCGARRLNKLNSPFTGWQPSRDHNHPHIEEPPKIAVHSIVPRRTGGTTEGIPSLLFNLIKEKCHVETQY